MYIMPSPQAMWLKDVSFYFYIVLSHSLYLSLSIDLSLHTQ